MTVAGRDELVGAGTSDQRPAVTADSRPAPLRARRAAATAVRHPVVTVAVVAALARLVMVVVVGPLRPGVFVPDEGQYLELAAFVARGDGAEAWQPGYGQSLYDATATFMRPLTALVAIFGPHQIVGQLLAAAAGVLAATLTTVLALRAVRPGFALMAGLTVALLPSQIFWSSVVLRESMVWAALVTLALSVTLAAQASSRRRLLVPLVLALAAGIALSDLRHQTAFVAVWCLVPAAVVVASRFRLLATSGAVLVAVAAPMFAGMGIGGFALVQEAVPTLAQIRGNLSIGAESSFIERTVLPPPQDEASGGAGSAGSPSVPGSPSGPSGASSGGGSGGAGEPRTGTGAAQDAGPPAPSEGPGTPPPDTLILTAPSGEQVLVEDSAGATLSALPRGLVAVALRPLPWEPAPNAGVLLAKAETPAWGLLYILAAVGVMVGWRRRAVLAYPFGVAVGIVAVAAVTQGNIGTAFRHRGQILWALVVLAAVGAQYLIDRRRSRES
jgi:hypothetical protein